LTPDNILFDGQGRPHIADFGLALPLEATFSLSRSMAGTAGYMAPEQVGGEQNLTIAVDVHALGAILYELLAGEPPFAREEWLLTLQRVRDETPPPLRGGRNGVAVDL
jgi:serine/threonine-protein kinase